MAVWFHSRLRRWTIRQKVLEQLVQGILAQTDRAGAHISLTLVGRIGMRNLNQKYRNRDYPTDVLSFPTVQMKQTGETFLGDVVICLPTAVSQASTYGNTSDQEFLRLLIHGVLHLLGYDHETSFPEAKRMQRKERAIFQRLSPVPKIIERPR